MGRKRERQRDTREFIDDLIRQREKWKAAEHERMEKENHRIQEYSKLQEQRKEAAEVEKRAREQALYKIQHVLGEQIQRVREEREQQELVRQELDFEEQEQTIRNREQDEIKSRLRKRLELQCERDEQINLKQLRDADTRQPEERFRAEVRINRRHVTVLKTKFCFYNS